jgi:hypothetical protein
MKKIYSSPRLREYGREYGTAANLTNDFGNLSVPDINAKPQQPLPIQPTTSSSSGLSAQ